MLANIWKFLSGAWRLLTFLGTVIGLLYLWPDIKDLPKAYGLKWEFPLWLGSEVIAYISLAFACGWLLWIEVRPFVRDWWQKRRYSSSFTVLKAIHCETFYIEPKSNENDTGLYENIFYLVVGNSLDTEQTL